MNADVKETYATINSNKVFLSCPHCHVKLWASIEKWEKILKRKYGHHVHDYDVYMNTEGLYDIENKCPSCGLDYIVTGWEIWEIDEDEENMKLAQGEI